MVAERVIFELTLRLGTHARSQNPVPAKNLCPSAAAGWRNIHRKWSGSQKLPKNIFNRCRFPAGIWIIDCLQEDSSGRTRTRTWDPLIKSQLGFLNQHTLRAAYGKLRSLSFLLILLDIPSYRVFFLDILTPSPGLRFLAFV